MTVTSGQHVIVQNGQGQLQDHQDHQLHELQQEIQNQPGDVSREHGTHSPSASEVGELVGEVQL